MVVRNPVPIVFRVTIFNSKYEPIPGGGAQQSVRLLTRGLVSTGCRVRVVTLTPRRRIGADALPSCEVLDGVVVRRWPVPNIYWPFTGRAVSGPLLRLLWHLIDMWNPITLLRALWELSRHRPDIVHTNNLAGFSPSVWSAARILRIPVVHTARDGYLISVSDATTGSRLSRILRAFVRWQSRRLAVLVCISEYLQRAHRAARIGAGWRRLHEPSRDVVIYNAGFEPADQSDVLNSGARQKVAASTSDAHQEATSSLGTTCGYLGKLEDIKGVHLLIDAWRTHGDYVPGARLLIAGSLGSDSRQTRSALAAGLPTSVELVGWADPREFLASLDVLIVPSLWNEPMGRVVAEAFQCGVPVIVSDRGALPELVHDRRDGLVFSHVAAPSLAEQLVSVLTNPELLKSLTRGARQRDVTEFTVPYMVYRYRDVYAQARR